MSDLTFKAVRDQGGRLFCLLLVCFRHMEDGGQGAELHFQHPVPLQAGGHGV